MRLSARSVPNRLLAVLACAALAACGRDAGPLAPEAAAVRPAVLLTVDAAGVGSGLVTSNPAGIRCDISGGVARGACSVDFPVGAVVTISASTGDNEILADWRGACYGTEACRVRMEGARYLSVAFLPASAIHSGP